ncbi:MAG: flagellar motor switch protein FliG [Deltaproteobacteria bacterium RIFOXYD12_FULL_57_12]|nr:MAG: flagellar motor switch protein FliG [Deltaproteobacteria bacterium RIFOXYD12_FULL_57_12]
MDFTKLSGAEKAAVLLLCLGEEATAKVFEQLTDSEVRMISRSMMTIDYVPSDVAKQVFAAYNKAQQGISGLFVKGSEFTKKAISATGNQQRFKALMEQVASGTEARPLETISMMEPRMVASILEHEHPQTLALILSTQRPEHTGKILSHFSEELKSEVMYRIAKIEKVSPEVITQIEEALQREIGVVVNKEQQQVGGIDKVVEILTRMEKGVDRNILIRMEETDPDLAEAIRRKMFTFDDLTGVDDAALQKILKEINTDTLTMSLKTASEELKKKIFNNISKRAGEMIQEDLDIMGPTKLSDVEAMQQVIIKTALRLEDEGAIILPGRGGRDVLV